MYLKSLHLENIACFEELDLDFTDENGEPCKWVVLLGENGTGKSSILKSVLETIGVATFVRSQRVNCDTRVVQISVSPDIRIDKFGDEVPNSAPGIIGWNKSGGHGFSRHDNFGFKYEEYIKNGMNGWFLGAYGPKRKMNFEYEKKDYNPIIDSVVLRRVRSLLGNDEWLTPPRVWLSDLDYEVLKLKSAIYEMEHGDNTADPDLDQNKIIERLRKSEDNLFRAIKAIEAILPDGVEYARIKPDKDIFFRENGLEVAIGMFSDGYKTSMSWIIDLVRCLVEAFPDETDPLDVSGVVLVDEIDLHLHPRWQRTIVQKIRKIFPNIQFIVTSHSPFIAQDMTEKDKIIVLTRDGDKVTAREEKGFVQNWRAGQILTSWLFGLPTDYDEKIEEKLGKQQELADRKAQGLLTDEEREELRQVTEFLSTLPSEETGEELLSQEHLDREAVRKAAATALRLLRKVEGK